MINVSETAASKINELLAEENKAGSGLRVFVQGGGCSGLPVRPDDRRERPGRGRPGVRVARRQAVRRSDQHPLPERRRSRLRRHVTGGGFTIKNPNATSTCGCGSSFSRRLSACVRRSVIVTDHQSPSPITMDRPSDSRACAPRRQALQQARPDSQRLPAPGRSPQRRRSVRSHPPRRSPASAAPPSIARCSGWSTPGIARKVDFGEGRSRFEPSYRHPRHFHLICKTCHRSSEFLSSDIEALIEEVAAARDFAPTQASCRSTAPARSAAPATHDAADRRRDDRAGVRARRAAHRDRHRAQRPRVLHPRRRAHQGSRAAARCSRSSRRKRRSISARSRSATASCSPADPQLESRPTFLFFKGAANGLFAEGAEQLRKGVNDQQALLIGIHCERGSHQFFKKYGERFEDSEGKQIFLEFADEERAHLDLLIREYRALRERQRTGRAAPKRRAAQVGAVDRSSHPYDRVRRPLHARRSSSRAPPRPASRS